MRFRKLFSIGAAALALLVAATASAQVQVGSIQGRVTDETTGVPMLLVTVVASSPSLQGTQSEFTDDAGQFYMSSLPAGTYSLLFIYGESKVKRDNVEVSIGKATVVNAKINTASTGEVITIKEKAPTIDAGSTKQGLTLTAADLKNAPSRGRTWQGVLGAAAGAQGDTYGTSFSGSTSIENNYVVDGLNTSGVSLGNVQGGPTQGAGVLNNFIQEIEIITGGYNAEFGRSTGGVVNVITKTGSNEFHGSVFANVTAINASVDAVQEAGTSLRGDAELPTSIDFGFELGGPIIKDRLWFYVGFAPVINRTTITRAAQTQVDRNVANFNYGQSGCGTNNDGSCDGDANKETTGRAGCELLPAPTGRTSACEEDGIADFNAQGFTIFEEIDRQEKTQTVNTYQFTAKLNFAVAPEHQGQLSLTGTPFVGSNIVGTVYGTPTRGQRNETQLTTDAAFKWTSKFFDNKTQVDLLVGWHRFERDTESINDVVPGNGKITKDTSRVDIIDNVPLLASDASRLFNTLQSVANNDDVPESQAVQMFCEDGTARDAFKRIKNCPLGTPGYGMYSPGRNVDLVEQRFSGKLTATQRVKAAGHHQIKVGADVEDNLLNNNRVYTGDMYIRNAAGGPGRWSFERYAQLDPNGTDYCATVLGADVEEFRCTYLGKGYRVEAETLNFSAFLQDSWSILPNLTVNAGLRYEQQYMRYADRVKGTIDPITMKPVGKNALELTDLLAPRIGLIYDWTKEGRSKIYANWGRFYNSIPMNMSDRSFGGEVQYWERWNMTNRCGTNANNANFPLFPSLPQNCPKATFGPTGMPGTMPTATSPNRAIIIGASDPAYGIPTGLTLVMPDPKAQYLDELVFGVEYELLEDLRVGLSYQNRRLGQVIEDISTDAGTTYFFGNPNGFTSGQEEDLVKQINSFSMDDPRRQQLITRLNAFKQTRLFDTPQRAYNAVQLTASKRFSRAFMVQGSYTYSTQEGDFPGLFSPDTGQLDPNITSMYDLFELMPNRIGKLPFDRPHAFKLDGYYKFDLKEAGEVTAGARLRGQSGIPYTPLAAHQVYGDQESYLNRRGDGGRTDFETGVDLHLAYGRKLGDMGLELYFELFNAFNRQGETHRDQEYTSADADPIVGGDKKDLYYLKSVHLDELTGVAEHELPGRNLNYGNTDGRQAPLSARIGLALSF